MGRYVSVIAMADNDALQVFVNEGGLLASDVQNRKCVVAE